MCNLLNFPTQTPAQPRFLLSKRHAPQSQKQPQKHATTPLQTGVSHQFVSTPRFNVTATSTQTSRSPLLFATPAPPTARQRTTQYDPLSDAIDTSPTSSDLAGSDIQRNHPLNESIEIDSPSASRPSSGEDNEPPPKRRRMSISPEGDLIPDANEADEPMVVDDGSIEIDSNTPPDDSLHSPIPSSVPSDRLSTSGSEGPASPTGPPPARHPTFHSAPRFKTTEPATRDAQKRPPLPDAFSPQRRGAKYVPGGLAAEVRDWLVQVKGVSEYDRPAGASVQVTVDAARAGNGMWIVASRHHYQQQTEGSGGGESREGGHPAKVILAGDGRIAGLGGRSAVGESGTVAMHQPMWDVTLGDLGQFAVACDWETSG